MIEQELLDIEDRAKKAHNLLCNLCEGKRRWTLSIPARPDDCDLVIDDSLKDIDTLVSYIRKQRKSKGNAYELNSSTSLRKLYRKIL